MMKLFRVAFAAFALIFVLPVHSMNNEFFKIQISVFKDANGHVHARTLYKNISSKPLYLDKSAPRFEVFDQAGNEVKYIGVMVKRGPLTLDDFELIQPSQTVERCKDITNLYRFKTHQAGEFFLALPGGYYDPQTDQTFEGEPVTQRFQLQQ